jgi:antitoxin VapB
MSGALSGSGPDSPLISHLLGKTLTGSLALMKTAKLFKNGESQAVRLPKEFRFQGEEVFIKRAGSAVVLFPKARSWDVLLKSLDRFPTDFMNDREQPSEAEQRDGLE